ncbi:MAG: lysoplasmalogenase family protein [Clostridiales Family XIII bacterium]|nr:lysoplasmalogenase family protein [Clostridiales Family XIII bacterium]
MNRILFFVILNVALYAAFLTLGIRAEHGFLADVLKFAGILSCLCLALCALSRPWRARDARLQIVCLVFTVCADFFLLFTEHFVLGVIIFYGAHLAALRRYAPKRFWPFAVGTAAYVAVSAVILRNPVTTAEAPAPEAVFSILYGILIVSVTIAAFRAEQPPKNALLSRLGMCLFLACDVNVALFNALPQGGAVHTAAAVLMWAFYLPAQTLLALSPRRL